LILQYEPNEHLNKTRNQTTPRKTMYNTTLHSNNEITTTKKTQEKLIYVKSLI